MGVEDIERQAPNVQRMELLGATVKPVDEGEGTLKDATSAAIRDWVAQADDTFYVIGSVVGPHPYPLMVRSFQKIIGEEARAQMLEYTGALPDLLVAAVGGGSNAIGLFYPFVKDTSVKMLGIEAGGISDEKGKHAKTLGLGRDGIIHGMRTVLLHDEHGHIQPVHSISAGLDYPGIGPEHAQLWEEKRAVYDFVRDDEALEAFHILSKMEGIIPALESAHALAGAMKKAGTMSSNEIILVNLSGRGDKDMQTVLKGAQ
jgi:tryptophan synthase beta chain